MPSQSQSANAGIDANKAKGKPRAKKARAFAEVAPATAQAFAEVAQASRAKKARASEVAQASAQERLQFSVMHHDRIRQCEEQIEANAVAEKTLTSRLRRLLDKWANQLQWLKVSAQASAMTDAS